MRNPMVGVAPKLVLSFVVMIECQALSAQFNKVFDISYEESTPLNGKPIATPAGKLDQPGAFYYHNGYYFILNEYGDDRLTVLDSKFRFANAINSSEFAYRIFEMVFHGEKASLFSGVGAATYNWRDLIHPGSLEGMQAPVILNSVFRESVFWWKDDLFVIHRNGDENMQDRVAVYDGKGKIRSFGRLPEGYRDANLNRNHHLSSIAAIDRETELFYLAYEYADLIEVYSLKTGEKLGQAHNIKYQFPPDHKVSMDGVAYPESDYYYFQTIKAAHGKLYALHRYRIPNFPTKSHPKMKLLIFDGTSLELEDVYELDEDWTDFIVFEDQLLGLCYYCEYPVRRYAISLP